MHVLRTMADLNSGAEATVETRPFYSMADFADMIETITQAGHYKLLRQQQGII